MTLAMKPSLVALTAFSFFAATYLVGYQPPLKAAEQAGTETTANQFRVPNGQLTFDLEGLECPDPSDKCIAFHSRIPHVPSEESGVTIGRGYDLKLKTPSKIKADLLAIGLSSENADIYSEAGCKVAIKGTCKPQYIGKQAKEFIKTNKTKLVEITPEQQKKLFAMTYSEIEADVKSIHNKNAKSKAEQTKNIIQYDNLNPFIKDILIDLRFRGDYTPESRKLIEVAAMKNDLAGFRYALSNSYWLSKKQPVSTDRFIQRYVYLGGQQSDVVYVSKHGFKIIKPSDWPGLTTQVDDYPSVATANEYSGNYFMLMNYDYTSKHRDAYLNKIKLEIYICGDTTDAKLPSGYGDCSTQSLGRLEAQIKQRGAKVGIINMSDTQAYILPQPITEEGGDWDIGDYKVIYYRKGGRIAVFNVRSDRKTSEMNGIVSSFRFLR
jgi:hypothetical protein